MTLQLTCCSGRGPGVRDRVFRRVQVPSRLLLAEVLVLLEHYGVKMENGARSFDSDASAKYSLP